MAPTSTDLDDLLGTTDDGRPAPIRRKHDPSNPRSPKTRRNMGALHDLLTEKLPDLCTKGTNPVCDLHQLAKELAMTYQGVYKWFKPGRDNQLPFNQVKRIVALSERQTLKAEHLTDEQKAAWKPATEADFHPFIV